MLRLLMLKFLQFCFASMTLPSVLVVSVEMLRKLLFSHHSFAACCLGQTQVDCGTSNARLLELWSRNCPTYVTKKEKGC